MRKALMLCLALMAGATYAPAQSVTTPAVPIDIIEPIHAWTGDQGHVWITVHITKSGRVDRIIKNTASEQLRPLYEHYARQWRFKPALRDGQPVEWTRSFRFDYVITSTYTLLPD